MWGSVVLAVLLVVMAEGVRSGGFERDGLVGVRTEAAVHCDERWGIGYHPPLVPLTAGAAAPAPARRG
ncbi:hypothetical protein MO973_38200 [Paenibacillus sp. TRM 82003]|nr:hypothetical protein [Paenibacillus sp. TRM 82003]